MDQKALLANIKDIVINIRRDAQEGVVFPMAYNTEGKPLFELKLLSTGGQRQFDTDKIIQRYDQRIAMTAVADFLLLGQDKVGSFALAKSKTTLFATAIGAFLDIIADVFNRYAIPRLFALNDFQISDYPQITHGDLENVDLGELGDYIQKLSLSGFPLMNDPELQKYLMKVAHLPEPPEMLTQEDIQIDESKNPGTDSNSMVSIPGLPIQTPTGLAKPADTTPVNQKPPVTSPVVTNQLGNTETNSFTDNRKVTDEAEEDRKRFPMY